MARIEQSRIEAIKQLSLLDWIEGEGYSPKREGADYVMHCIFHEDKTPSLKISPKKNLFHCFGCGAGGRLIDWVKRTQGLEFRDAVTYIEQRQGTVPSRPRVAPAQSSHLAAELLKEDVQAALTGAADYYHSRLKQSAEGLAYLESRGLRDDELIETFRLGISDKTLTASLAAKHTQAGKQQRQLLQACGILKPSGYEHFAGCLTVPSLNSAGEAVELYGRRLQPYSHPRHLYLPGPHTQVWNPAGFVDTDTLILCEALIDAMTVWVHGFKHVTASYGTNGFTDAHLDLLRQHAIKKLLIAYDRDKAGDTAAGALADQLEQYGIACYRVLLPKGMDINAYALKMNPAGKALQQVIDKAEPMNKNPEVRIQNSGETQPPSDSCILTPDSSKPNSLTVTETEATIAYGSRHYRVRGLSNNTKLDQLKITLSVRHSDRHYVDSLDLYQAKARHQFIAQASEELGIETGVLKRDIGQLLLALEDHQEQTLNAQVKVDKEKTPDLTPEQKTRGLALLTDPNLVERIVADINTLGLIGEDSNALVSYLACVSRKLDNPLAVTIQSTSAAGKSTLMDRVLALMPENEQYRYAAMTGQSLYYMGRQDLQHKILAIAEEEGAHNASYALKLLQSEGEVSIASTGKNETTGELETRTYHVEGPVMLMLTTTAIDIDEELLNRCLVLTVNESREQTQAIHAMQRKKRTLAGLKDTLKKQTLTDQHHAAQHLLRPLRVINPYAEQLTFLSDKTRTRRDHEKYLTLIDSIALLHQYQREIKTLPPDEGSGGPPVEYIEVTLQDIEIANRLAHAVLGRSLDELPPQTRTLLNLITDMVTENCQREAMTQSDYRFSRKQIREYTGWSDGQLKIHCHRLEDMEYLLVHRGGRGHSIQYELLHVPNPQQTKTMPGLIDVDELKKLSSVEEKSGVQPQKSGQKAQKSAPSQGQVRPKSGGCQGAKTATNPDKNRVNGAKRQPAPKTHSKANKQSVPSDRRIEGLRHE